VVAGYEDKVHKSNKALYGLRQALRAWNSKINGYLLQTRFMKSPSEPSLYIMTEGQDLLIPCINKSTNQGTIEDSKKTMVVEFEITNLRLMKYVLGIHVNQNPSQNFIS